MRHRFYRTSRSAWNGMLNAIEHARESIYLEMYILENDTAGNDFLLALERRAKEGLRVVVILDAVGSYSLAHADIDRLRIAGAEVLLWSAWFRRTHRKLLIVDEFTTFVGGVNISKRFALWGDLQVRISGKTFARSALHSFARMYRECGGTNPALGSYAKLRLFDRARSWFIEHGVAGKRQALRLHYEKRIDGARRSITLITPYLIPQRWMIAHLHEAILRGVAIEIMIPEHTDHPLIDYINTGYLDTLSKLGAQCYRLREMNHAKAMVVDESEAIIGSHNLDTLSFDHNAEAGVFFNDKRMIIGLIKIIDSWRGRATLYTRDAHPRRWFDPPLALLLRIFHPVL